MKMIGIEEFIFPEWPAPANIQAVTTVRTGGVSARPFNSLNPALHVGDLEEAVLENRRRIRDCLALPSEPVWLRQVHGDKVVDAGSVLGVVEADASFADRSGVVCAVLTADCLPILFCSRDGNRIAAAHVGWRGLYAGIISRTVEALGADKPWVWLGPAIGPEAFEVGSDVRDAFVRKSAECALAFQPHGNGKWLADLYRLARIELLALGITDVYGGQWCTFSDSKRFYSYRRDTETGRMATLIWRD